MTTSYTMSHQYRGGKYYSSSQMRNEKSLKEVVGMRSSSKPQSVRRSTPLRRRSTMQRRSVERRIYPQAGYYYNDRVYYRSSRRAIEDDMYAEVHPSYLGRSNANGRSRRHTHKKKSTIQSLWNNFGVESLSFFPLMFLETIKDDARNYAPLVDNNTEMSELLTFPVFVAGTVGNDLGAVDSSEIAQAKREVVRSIKQTQRHSECRSADYACDNEGLDMKFYFEEETKQEEETLVDNNVVLGFLQQLWPSSCVNRCVELTTCDCGADDKSESFF